MDWKELNTLGQLDQIDVLSREKPVLIFKHSTRCSISRAALGRLEREWQAGDGGGAIYYLDLLAHRAVSDAVAERYGVEHESPQVLVIRDGKCVHNASHMGITYQGTVGMLAL